jgi:hypothetical protein
MRDIRCKRVTFLDDEGNIIRIWEPIHERCIAADCVCECHNKGDR